MYADAETIRLIVDAGYDLLKLVPPLETDDTDEFIKAYGTRRFYHYTVKKVGKEAILFSFCTAWAPPYEYLEKLMNHKKGIEFLKSEWDIATDGVAGVWVAERKKEGDVGIKSIEWYEGCIEEQLERFGEL
jgi:hypothetical protein